MLVGEILKSGPKPVTVKITALLATPPTVTTTFPVVAPAGTEVTMLVALQPVTVAAVPLNVTVLVPWEDPKFVPVIVTAVPTAPDVVDRLVIAGLTLVNVQFRISWVAVFPPVPAVKPTKAALSPTTLGMLTAQLVVKVAFVIVSVMVIVKVVPS